MKIDPIERFRAMRFALAGLGTLFRTQANSWIYLGFTLVIGVAGTIVGLNSEQWIWLLLAISLVWVTELLNTAIEFTCDLVTRDHHELVKNAKDTAAAAVFIAGIVALVVIAWVFWSATRVM